MAIESAKKFLEQVMKDEALRARMADNTPEKAAAVATELGFDVTAKELEQAEQELRKARKSGEAPVDLSPDELDKVAGGVWWLSEDAPDGYEFACILTYHNAAYQYQNGYWCKEQHYCNQNHVWYI